MRDSKQQRTRVRRVSSLGFFPSSADATSEYIVFVGIHIKEWGFSKLPILLLSRFYCTCIFFYFLFLKSSRTDTEYRWIWTLAKATEAQGSCTLVLYLHWYSLYPLSMNSISLWILYRWEWRFFFYISVIKNPGMILPGIKNATLLSHSLHAGKIMNWEIRNCRALDSILLFGVLFFLFSFFSFYRYCNIPCRSTEINHPLHVSLFFVVVCPVSLFLVRITV